MEAHTSRIIVHMLHLTTKSYSSIEWVSCTYQYMLEPIPLSTIQTIASIQLSSHSFSCETSHPHVTSLVDYAHFSLKNFESLAYHNVIQCSTFDHIQLCFQYIFNQTQSLKEFISWSQCALAIVNVLATHIHMYYMKKLYFLVSYSKISLSPHLTPFCSLRKIGKP